LLKMEFFMILMTVQGKAHAVFMDTGQRLIGIKFL